MRTKTLRAKKATNGMKFVQACQVWADMFFDFRKRGGDMGDEDRILGMFETEGEAVGIPEELRKAAFASFLDQRECELGWG